MSENKPSSSMDTYPIECEILGDRQEHKHGPVTLTVWTDGSKHCELHVKDMCVASNWSESYSWDKFYMLCYAFREYAEERNGS